MEPNQDRSLIPSPSHELTAQTISQNRILGDMVEHTLALGRQEAVAQTARFRIGDYAWCEPDYRQILLWAETLKMEPLMVIGKLLADERSSKTADGLMRSLLWDLVELPLSDFKFVADSAIESLQLVDSNTKAGQLLAAIFCPKRLRHRPLPPIVGLRDITLFRPGFRELICCDCGIQALTISGAHELTHIKCTFNKMEKLALFDVPSLSSLSCCFNQLAELDLSHVPNLTRLSCHKNRIAELDIRPLLSLETLSYDKHSTRLIQRPDQGF